MKPEQIVKILKDSVIECGRIHISQGYVCAGCEMNERGLDCQRHLAARNLIAAGAIATGWIPTSERMPETSDMVLVLARGGIKMLAQWDKISWLFFGSYNGDEWTRQITHWMPIPLDAPMEV